MKFDKIIMNPPYSGSLHLKILSEAMKHGNEVVNLSPIRWLQDELVDIKNSNKGKKPDYYAFEDLRNHIVDLLLISAHDAQNMFGNVMNMDLGVYYIKDGKSLDLSFLRNSVCSKVMKSTFSSFDYNKKDGWRVRVITVAGGKSGGSGNRKIGLQSQKLLAFYDGKKDGEWWYNFYQKNQYSKTTETLTTSIKFDTENEAQNFINVMSNSKLGRYYYDKMCCDVHIYPQFFIKLDYTHPWTDEQLYDYFELTPEEKKIIEDEIR